MCDSSLLTKIPNVLLKIKFLLPHLGLYIPANCSDVPVEFRGIGIRIEDDVLYTKDGAEVLTKDCIKEVSKLKTLISK